MSRYKKALKQQPGLLCKLIENSQNNPRFLFNTVARLTNKQTSLDQNITLQFSSNYFMNYFDEKIESIRNTIINVQSSIWCLMFQPQLWPLRTTTPLYNYRTGRAK